MEDLVTVLLVDVVVADLWWPSSASSALLVSPVVLFIPAPFIDEDKTADTSSSNFGQRSVSPTFPTVYTEN